MHWKVWNNRSGELGEVAELERPLSLMVLVMIDWARVA